MKPIIAKLRKYKGWNQEELAEKLHVSRSTVAMWESGKNIPPSVSMYEMSKLFGCSIDMLIGVQNVDDARSPGEMLTNYMILNGDSLKTVGRILGLSDEDIHRICSDDLMLTPDQAKIIGERYGTNPEKFLPELIIQEPLTSDDYTPEERALIRDFRSLNAQGKAYILQTMAMSVTIYKNENHDISDVEIRA